MQIVYLGFAGAARIEAEAAVQLLRLERFSTAIGGCHLAIEALHSAGGGTVYDARLDLVMRDHCLLPVPHCVNVDPERAIRCAFDSAEKVLRERGSDTEQAMVERL